MLAAILLATVNVPVRGGDDEPGKQLAAQASAGDQTLAAVPSDLSAPVTPGIAPSVANRAETPSLEQVLELLQVQGQEIASLRAALRDQQELTARLAAKLNVASPALIVAEPLSRSTNPSGWRRAD